MGVSGCFGQCKRGVDEMLIEPKETPLKDWTDSQPKSTQVV